MDLVDIQAKDNSFQASLQISFATICLPARGHLAQLHTQIKVGLDKASLDAIASEDTNEVHTNVATIFGEIHRVLRPDGGR